MRAGGCRCYWRVRSLVSRKRIPVEWIYPVAGTSTWSANSAEAECRGSPQLGRSASRGAVASDSTKESFVRLFSGALFVPLSSFEVAVATERRRKEAVLSAPQGLVSGAFVFRPTKAGRSIGRLFASDASEEF